MRKLPMSFLINLYNCLSRPNTKKQKKIRLLNVGLNLLLDYMQPKIVDDEFSIFGWFKDGNGNQSTKRQKQICVIELGFQSVQNYSKFT